MHRFQFTTLLLILATIGCGGGVKDAPKTVAVTGTVTFAGSPVSGATVNFSAGGKIAVGITDSNGTFILKTGSTEGAVPGTYTVTVSPGGEIPMPGTEEAKNYDPDSVLPSKYADPTASGLTAEVSDSGENTFDFNLEK